MESTPTATGSRDPYNPEDAIFAAARYLSAAGMPADTYGAIYSYNHADWYVERGPRQRRLLRRGVGGQHGRQRARADAAAEGPHLPAGRRLEGSRSRPTTWTPSRTPPPATNWASAASGRWPRSPASSRTSAAGWARASCDRTGPLGLEPTEWRKYAVDGDEDGHIRHADLADSAATLARLIWSRGSLRAGIFTHNQAEWYVQAVLADAEEIEGNCKTSYVDWAVALPAAESASINWSNLTLSNSLELHDLTSGALDPRIVDLIGADHPAAPTTISALRSRPLRTTTSGNVSDHYFGAGDGHRLGRRRLLHRDLADRALRRTRPHALANCRLRCIPPS